MERSVAHLLLAVYCALCAIASAQCAENNNQDARSVSNIGELISTPRWNSASKRQIRIRGTISVVAGMLGDIVTNPKDKSFCVEDESAGIWIRVTQAVDEGLLEDTSVLSHLKAGMTAEIEGSLHPGGFAPVVLPRRIKLLGPGELKQDEHPDLKDFFRGAYIMRRITVGGVVQNVTDDSPGWLVRVETGAGHFLTRLPKTDGLSPATLMDAEIQVTGVAGASRNWRSQFICPRVMIAEADDIQILRSPSEDPFQAERVRIDELDGFNPKGRSLHRRCLEGAVAYYDGDKTIYLLNDGIGVRLELNEPSADTIQLGDWIEASGFIDPTQYLRGLRGAIVRSTGKKGEIKPVKTSVEEIVDDHTVPTWKQVHTKTYDGRVVTMRGEVRGFDSATERFHSRIEVASGETTFTASLHEPMEELLPGTIVELTGIAKITYLRSDSTSQLAEPQRVDMLLRSEADVNIIRKPSWWTEQRIGGALALAICVAGLAVIWGVTLNRRVAKQTKELALEMSSRRDAAIEFQAAIRERTHLAANIHDTVLQTLAGIGCQLDACGQSTQPNTPISMHLKTASRMVQGGQEDLRNVVSALHCLPLHDQTFGESIRRVVKRLKRVANVSVSGVRDGEDLSRLGPDADDRPKIIVQCAANLPKLADFIAGNLLLIIQEATRNALKYADAESITIKVKTINSGSGIRLKVVDDGCGFDANTRPGPSDGHFGLETMKGRAERIEGSLTIESEPGQGTSVTATALLRSFDEAIT